MVKIGDRYKERVPSWVKGKDRYFSWEYEVVGFHSEPYADFADCVRTYADGRKDTVGISISLLLGEKSSFEKIAPLVDGASRIVEKES